MWVNTLNPVIFNLGPLAVRWYGLAYLFGALLAYWTLLHAQKSGKIRLTKTET